MFEASAQNASEVATAWTPWYVRPFVSVIISAGLKQFDNLKNAGIDTTYHEFPKATHFDIGAQENFVQTVKDFLN